MKQEIVLSLLLAAILSSTIIGYPPLYYIYLIHEIILALILFWFISLLVLKKYSRLLEILTLSLLILLVILPPINKSLAPEYASEFNDNLTVHTDYLVKEIGERPFLSENEKKAAAYIEDVLQKKGFSPIHYSNGTILAFVEGKKEDIVIFCAHYDTVPNSPGADDNASGVSVLLELTVPENPEHTIVIAFFTGEEVGLMGSRSCALELDNVSGVICVDTVGIGKDFHISSLKKNRSVSFFLSQVVYGLSDSAIPSIGPLYSDHVPFNERGIKAVGLTRSTQREYPHIHSEMDSTVDADTLEKTGETVQEILDHFSYSGSPYSFVYESLIFSGIISGILAFFIENLMNRIKI